MADAKSRFKRPEHPTPPTPVPEAEEFISGSTSSTAAQASRAEPAAGPAKADQAEKTSTRPEAMKRLTIDIPESLHKRVKSQCANQGTTIADVVRQFLEKKFSEPKA